jgi:hypothetical protein
MKEKGIIIDVFVGFHVYIERCFISVVRQADVVCIPLHNPPCCTCSLNLYILKPQFITFNLRVIFRNNFPQGHSTVRAERSW